MTEPTFYAATVRFPANPNRERVVLLEAIHPAAFALLWVEGMDPDLRPSLLHWSTLTPEEASGLRDAYEIAGERGDVVTLDAVRDRLEERLRNAQSAGAHLAADNLRTKLEAAEAYAAGIGHVFEGAGGPRR